MAKYNKQHFQQTLANSNWSVMYQCNTADGMLTNFLGIVLSAVRKHAPLKRVFVSQKAKMQKRLG